MCVCQCLVEIIHRYWSTLIIHLIIKYRIWYPFLAGLTHDAGTFHGKWLPIYVFRKRPNENSRPAFFFYFFRHKTQACCGRRSAICKSRFHFQTDAAKTYKPSAAHEIWMISCRILCTKAPLWQVANTANTDLAVQLSAGEENETRLRQEWKWPRGRVAAHNLTDSHDVRADVPDKSNRLCRFKRTMMASASDSPKENSRTNREECYRGPASLWKLFFF